MPENKQQIMKPQNKIAVITGGSSGIGLATAKELNQNGEPVVIVGRDAEAINKAASEDIYDLGEYLFVSRFYLKYNYTLHELEGAQLPFIDRKK